jgi:hypothetical protein
VKRKMVLKFKKEDLRFKPRIKLKASIKHKDKTKYSRKQKNKKDRSYE